MPTGVYPRKSIEQRLAENVYVAGDDNCLVWRGVTNWAGYGRVKWAGRIWSAHRLSWTLANGPIPGGLFVLHKCDNRSCVRPDHLFLGTHQDNMVDMVEKARAACGSRNGNSKLTESDVLSIRGELRRGATETQLADKFGVDVTNISCIKLGKTWKEINANT